MNSLESETECFLFGKFKSGGSYRRSKKSLTAIESGLSS
jgi:hypothetical protein